MPLDVISTVLVAAASYDLVDVVTAKDELQIPAVDTSKDAFIARAISQISAVIAQETNRVFAVETVQDQIFPGRDAYPGQLPGGVRPLQLSRWPLIAPPFSIAAAAPTSSGKVLLVASTDGIAAGMPVGHASVPVGTTVASYVADTSITLSAAVTGTVAAGDEIGFGLVCAIIDPSGTTTRLSPGTDFLIDAQRGWLTRLNKFTLYPCGWDAVQTLVAYQSGFPTIPPDLVDATLRAVTLRNLARSRDPMLKSQDMPGLGTQTFWVGSVPGVAGVFPEEISAILDNYRVPVVA